MSQHTRSAIYFPLYNAVLDSRADLRESCLGSPGQRRSSRWASLLDKRAEGPLLILQQKVRRASLHHSPFVHDNDRIAVDDRGQPVCDGDDGRALESRPANVLQMMEKWVTDQMPSELVPI